MNYDVAFERVYRISNAVLLCGKLMANSNLQIISTRIELHLNSINDIFKTFLGTKTFRPPCQHLTIIKTTNKEHCFRYIRLGNVNFLKQNADNSVFFLFTLHKSSHLSLVNGTPLRLNNHMQDSSYTFNESIDRQEMVQQKIYASYIPNESFRSTRIYWGFAATNGPMNSPLNSDAMH